MPFNCDVCGAECGYNSPIVETRVGGEIVVCRKCWKKIDKESKAKGG